MPIRGFLLSTCGWVSTLGKHKTKKHQHEALPGHHHHHHHHHHPHPHHEALPDLARLCPRPFAFYNGGTGRNGVEGETGGGEGGGGGGEGGRGGLACLGMKVASSPSVEIAIRLAK